MLFDINGYQWYITCSCCATETCNARSRWSSMRGLHFFYAKIKEDSEMANKTFFTYDEQIEKLEKEKQLVISDPEFAKTTLQKLGYFSLIGGYKDLFKHKPSGNYLHGVTFESL